MPTDWSTADWSKSTSELAKLHNTTISNVSKARRRHARHTLNGYAGRPPAPNATRKPRDNAIAAANHALTAANHALTDRLKVYWHGLQDANRRITDLTQALADAEARAHQLEHQRDQLRRERERLTGHPQPTTNQPQNGHMPAATPTRQHVNLDALRERLGGHTYDLLRGALHHHPDLAPMIGANTPDTHHDLQPGSADLNFHHPSAQT